MSEPTAPEPEDDLGITDEDLAGLAFVFAEWDRRYREDPDGFDSDVKRLLRGQEVEEYGVAAALYFAELVAELEPDVGDEDDEEVAAALEDLEARIRVVRSAPEVTADPPAEYAGTGGEQ